jgi:hypothetical protein
MATFADDTAATIVGDPDEYSTRRNKKIITNQSSSMPQTFHMPTQLNILVLLLMPRYGGQSILRKNVMSSTSSSGKCIGYLEAILICQSTTKSYYTIKLCFHFAVMVSISGAASANLIFK